MPPHIIKKLCEDVGKLQVGFGLLKNDMTWIKALIGTNTVAILGTLGACVAYIVHNWR